MKEKEVLFFIKKKMKEKKITQKDLAKNIGINKSNLVRYFNGETQMKFCIALKIFKILDLNFLLIEKI